MARNFVDYGIDLGTTNSCIAVFENGQAAVLKNNEDADYTPSVVYCQKDGAMIVGRAAKEKLDRDSENTASEFKLQMGSEWQKHFVRSNQWLRPEHLSAEVLKSLKRNSVQRRNEEISAAVITVPAAFEAPQNDATRKAAQLAGISHSPLVQEPVAAALAYGFQQSDRRSFWLVYDFGGGTFDAALIKSQGGIIQVINHGGDNHLGGKLIDWAIVEELLVPAVVSQHGLNDFGRSSEPWIGAIATLKAEAETAKIRLSLESSYEVDAYLRSGDGREVHFEYALRKDQVEKLAEPYIRRSIKICKKIMDEARVGPGDIEKVLLVGGPTLMIYLRELLKDAADGLGIPLEHSHNPMTVVAEGASIFAATQPAQEAEVSVPVPGQYAITLDYKQIGDDPEPMIGGEVTAPGGKIDFSGYSIEFSSSGARTPWKSGRIPLNAQGKFTAELWAPDKQNNFLIELSNPQGGKLSAAPGSISYTRGQTPGTAPLTHSIGIALASNEVDWFFRKGDALPKKSKPHRLNSAYFFRKDQVGVVLRVPIVEGEYEKADRNHLIGHLEVTSEHIKRDIRAGEEVEVEIEIDASRLLTTKVYSIALNEEIDAKLTLIYKTLNIEQLRTHTQGVRSRLEKVKQTALTTGDPKALLLLNDLDKDGIIQEINKLQNAAAIDHDARDKWEKKLRELDAGIDDVESAVEIPALVAEAQQSLTHTQHIADRLGTAVDKQNFLTLQRDLLSTMRAHITNPDELRRKVKLMNEFGWQIASQRPEFWIEQLATLELCDVREFTNADEARELLIQGRRAVNSGEIEKLKAAVRQLWQLQSLTQPDSPSGYGGTLIRG